VRKGSKSRRQRKGDSIPMARILAHNLAQEQHVQDPGGDLSVREKTEPHEQLEGGEGQPEPQVEPTSQRKDSETSSLSCGEDVEGTQPQTDLVNRNRRKAVFVDAGFIESLQQLESDLRPQLRDNGTLLETKLGVPLLIVVKTALTQDSETFDLIRTMPLKELLATTETMLKDLEDVYLGRCPSLATGEHHAIAVQQVEATDKQTGGLSVPQSSEMHDSPVVASGECLRPVMMQLQLPRQKLHPSRPSSARYSSGESSCGEFETRNLTASRRHLHDRDLRLGHRACFTTQDKSLENGLKVIGHRLQTSEEEFQTEYHRNHVQLAEDLAGSFLRGVSIDSTPFQQSHKSTGSRRPRSKLRPGGYFIHQWNLLPPSKVKELLLHPLPSAHKTKETKIIPQPDANLVKAHTGTVRPVSQRNVMVSNQATLLSVDGRRHRTNSANEPDEAGLFLRKRNEEAVSSKPQAKTDAGVPKSLVFHPSKRNLTVSEDSESGEDTLQMTLVQGVQEHLARWKQWRSEGQVPESACHPKGMHLIGAEVPAEVADKDDAGHGKVEPTTVLSHSAPKDTACGALDLPSGWLLLSHSASKLPGCPVKVEIKTLERKGESALVTSNSGLLGPEGWTPAEGSPLSGTSSREKRNRQKHNQLKQPVPFETKSIETEMKDKAEKVDDSLSQYLANFRDQDLEQLLRELSRPCSRALSRPSTRNSTAGSRLAARQSQITPEGMPMFGWPSAQEVFIRANRPAVPTDGKPVSSAAASVSTGLVSLPGTATASARGAPPGSAISSIIGSTGDSWRRAFASRAESPSWLKRSLDEFATERRMEEQDALPALQNTMQLMDGSQTARGAFRVSEPALSDARALTARGDFSRAAHTTPAAPLWPRLPQLDRRPLTTANEQRPMTGQSQPSGNTSSVLQRPQYYGSLSLALACTHLEQQHVQENAAATPWKLPSTSQQLKRSKAGESRPLLTFRQRLNAI
jgi:hypothetical protein